jgi:hypothetical protein
LFGIDIIFSPLAICILLDQKNIKIYKKQFTFPTNPKSKIELHSLVVWTAAALRRDPIDNLIRVSDVAGFAVYTVGKIDFYLAPVCFRIFFHFIDCCRAKTLARIAVFFGASRRADFRV